MIDLSSQIPNAEKLPQKLGVAVSGGADSLALTLLLQDFCKHTDRTLFAITVDHGLRADSGDEALQVQHWLQMHHIHHDIIKVEIEHHNQSAYRKARYGAIESWAKTHNINTVFLGHHAQDQVETILLNISRGSGVRGLAGMQKVSKHNDITYIRPLLDVMPDGLKIYLNGQNQDWIEDPSNHSDDYWRSRMRKIWPTLQEQGFQVKRLCNMAAHMQEQSDVLDDAIALLCAQSVIQTSNGYRIYFPLWNAVSEQLQTACLKDLLIRLSNAPAPRYDSIHSLLSALQAGDCKKTLATCVIERNDNTVTITQIGAHNP